jgi:hypothetical protein
VGTTDVVVVDAVVTTTLPGPTGVVVLQAADSTDSRRPVSSSLRMELASNRLLVARPQKGASVIA